MKVINSEMDFIDDVEHFGLWLSLFFAGGDRRDLLLLLFFLVSVYALRFYMVHLSLGPRVERGNLLMYIMKNWLSRDRKISGLPIHE